MKPFGEGSIIEFGTENQFLIKIVAYGFLDLNRRIDNIILINDYDTKTKSVIFVWVSPKCISKLTHRNSLNNSPCLHELINFSSLIRLAERSDRTDDICRRLRLPGLHPLSVWCVY